MSKENGGSKNPKRKAEEHAAGTPATGGTGDTGDTGGPPDGSETGDTAKGHVHGSMDATGNQKVFEGMIKGLIVLFGVSFLVLIFLAIFNT